jgi:probable F420-dependent oxidoreductase
MKVRVGYGLGNLRSLSSEQLAGLADGLESHGFDSLWLSERVSGPAPEPLVALAFAAGRTSRIKFGTSVQVLPGRNPALLAKQWATLDVLSGGRALPAFGLGIAQPVEQQLFGVERKERAPWFEEALPLIRRLWSEDDVVHHGERFHYDGVTVLPKPTEPLDVWLGGKAPVELRRVGRLADGWLASFSTPQQCADGRIVIDEAASAAGRPSIDREHFGAMVLYSHDELPEPFLQVIRSRNPDIDPRELVPRGWPAVRELCERYVDVGFSKLVLVPLTEPKSWDDELAAGAEEALPIQT